MRGARAAGVGGDPARAAVNGRRRSGGAGPAGRAGGWLSGAGPDPGAASGAPRRSRLPRGPGAALRRRGGAGAGGSGGGPAGWRLPC